MTKEIRGQTELMVKGTDGTHLHQVLPPTIVKNNINREEYKQVSEVSQVSHPSSKGKNRFCGECGRFHLPSCGFPNGAFEKVPADWWANEMRCWIKKQPEMPNFDDKE